MTHRLQVVCLDFDGTIMAYDGNLAWFHPEAIRTLNALEPLGIAWCANSGRNRESQLEVLELSRQRGLTHWPQALLCSESLIFLRENGSYQPLATWNAAAQAMLHEFHVRVQQVLAPWLEAWRAIYQPQRVWWQPDATVFLLSTEADAPLRLHREMEALLRVLPDGVVIRNGGYVAALPGGLGKGNVLRAYLDHVGIAPDRALAIGDHVNDLSMLDGSCVRHVGCPGDACADVQAAVRKAGGRVAARPGPDGTVEIIEHYLGRQGCAGNQGPACHATDA